jgi:uncharacterized protein (DUF58 family)
MTVANVPVVPLRDLSPDDALRRLELLVTRHLDGLLQGDHLAVLSAAGTEPADARAYVPGQDDSRRIDWNVTARLSEPYVRDTVADRELETWALVDASASMDFGTALMEKRDVAAAATVAVAHISGRNGDRFGAIVLGSGRIVSVPMRSGRAHLHAVLRGLVTAPRTATGTPTPSLRDGLRRLSGHRRRGFRVVVSDFLDLSSAAGFDWEPELRRLAHRHHVLVIEVVDPREETLPNVGVLSLVDPETGAQRTIDTSSRRLRKRYAAAATEHRSAVASAVRRAGAMHLVLRTDGDWPRDLAQFLVRQRRLAAHGLTARRGS